MRKYTHDEMHHHLYYDSSLCPLVMRMDGQAHLGQALMCPYYVKLQGVLGSDWGVIVNPKSVEFGNLVFEHWQCGCPEGDHDQGKQVTDEWRDRKRERDDLRARQEAQAGLPDGRQADAGGVPPGTRGVDEHQGR